MSDDKKSKKSSAKFDNLLDVFDQKEPSDKAPKLDNTQVPKSDGENTPKPDSKKSPKLDGKTSPKSDSSQKSRNQLLKEGGMKQVKLLIDTETYKRFRMAHIDLDTDMSTTAEKLMQAWLEAYDRGEVGD